jgi:hypothetical protein
MLSLVDMLTDTDVSKGITVFIVTANFPKSPIFINSCRELKLRFAGCCLGLVIAQFFWQS